METSLHSHRFINTSRPEHYNYSIGKPNILRMWCFCLSLSFLSISFIAGQTVRTFVDDLGVEHSTNKSKPSFITSARSALFFYHHGGGTEQLLAMCKYI